MNRRADAALMWPGWAELQWSDAFPVTARVRNYSYNYQHKHLTIGWKRGEDINARARYDRIRQEVIDEGGYKRVGVSVSVQLAGRGAHTNLWFVDCRQHVLNTLPLWVMIWGDRQKRKSNYFFKNQLFSKYSAKHRETGTAGVTWGGRSYVESWLQSACTHPAVWLSFKVTFNDPKFLNMHFLQFLSALLTRRRGFQFQQAALSWYLEIYGS